MEKEISLAEFDELLSGIQEKGTAKQIAEAQLCRDEYFGLDGFSPKASELLVERLRSLFAAANWHWEFTPHGKAAKEERIRAQHNLMFPEDQI